MTHEHVTNEQITHAQVNLYKRNTEYVETRFERESTKTIERKNEGFECFCCRFKADMFNSVLLSSL